MKLNLHPHYEILASADMKKAQEVLRRYDKPEGLTLIDRTIPGPEGAPDIEIRIFKPEAAPAGTPTVSYTHLRRRF